MKTSIALIGFMGTGKSTVGRALAARLGKEFIELDALIEMEAGKTITEIFHTEGEIGFREREIEMTRRIAGRKNAVIACGGGIVLNKINIDRLRQECIIVCLTASPSVILRRTAAGRDRPLLESADRPAQISTLLRRRRPLYEQAADFSVNTSRMSPDSVVKHIIEGLKRYEGYHQ
ncbi:MAG: shikimate kinase [Dehalococcoidales bacterium]|nr:shikimate kinase [Dehalococcoidales bacterium]